MRNIKMFSKFWLIFKIKHKNILIIFFYYKSWWWSIDLTIFLFNMSPIAMPNLIINSWPRHFSHCHSWSSIWENYYLLGFLIRSRFYYISIYFRCTRTWRKRRSCWSFLFFEIFPLGLLYIEYRRLQCFNFFLDMLSFLVKYFTSIHLEDNLYSEFNTLAVVRYFSRFYVTV